MQTIPASWVDRIFARLQGIYGREFTGQFSVIDNNGNDIGMENAKTVWGQELGCFALNPDAISFALLNLPDRAPNAIKFKELCRLAPRPTGDVRMGYSKTDVDDKAAKENLERIKDMMKTIKSLQLIK
jgi:hypothetical protein